MRHPYGLISSLLARSRPSSPYERRPIVQPPAIRKEFRQQASVLKWGQLPHPVRACLGQLRQSKALSPAGTTTIRHQPYSLRFDEVNRFEPLCCASDAISRDDAATEQRVHCEHALRPQ